MFIHRNMMEEFNSLETKELIAKEPANPRDSSRLLVLDRKSGSINHGFFSDLPHYLKPGDCLVLNNTKVWPARLIGKKKTGGKFELLLIRRLENTAGDLDGNLHNGRWLALSRQARKGLVAVFSGGMEATCVDRAADGEWIFEFSKGDLKNYVLSRGAPPLPQYILNARKASGTFCRPGSDVDDYQTVYAKHSGSIAAPTAGFHFTIELLGKIRSSGIDTAYVTLHIGWGTFRPVRCGKTGPSTSGGGLPSGHSMIPEHCLITEKDSAIINSARKRGGRIIPVGTSAVRTLETFSSQDGLVSPGEKDATLFIFPGYEFKAADAFITNFHIPGSAPLYMTASFAGKSLLLDAYRQAVKKKYRFYSYGDSMFIS